MSLSNLLDAPAEHPGLFGSSGLGSSGLGPSSLQQKRPPGSGDSTPTAAGAAAGGGPFDEGDAGKGKWRKKQPPQWGSKNNVIEMLNELIEELDGIEQQIAQQAVEHIHANEVGGCWALWGGDAIAGDAIAAVCRSNRRQRLKTDVGSSLQTPCRPCPELHTRPQTHLYHRPVLAAVTCITVFSYRHSNACYPACGVAGCCCRSS